MNNRWFRSTLIRIGFDMPERASDWWIEPESIKLRWITRDNGSRTLLVHGMIQNLLAADMILPQLLITFFAADQPDQALCSTVAHAIHPIQDDNIRESSFLNPAWDLSPAAAESSRPFTILLENVPEKTTDFTLLPTMQATSTPIPH